MGVVKTSLNSSDGINVQLDFSSYWFMRAPHFNQSEIKSIVLNIQKGLNVCVSVTSVKMCVGEKRIRTEQIQKTTSLMYGYSYRFSSKALTHQTRDPGCYAPAI